jgi:hypothetical protein
MYAITRVSQRLRLAAPADPRPLLGEGVSWGS